MNIWLDLIEPGGLFEYLTRFIWTRWIIWIFDQVYCKPGGLYEYLTRLIVNQVDRQPAALVISSLIPADEGSRSTIFYGGKKIDLPFTFTNYEKWS